MPGFTKREFQFLAESVDLFGKNNSENPDQSAVDSCGLIF